MLQLTALNWFVNIAIDLKKFFFFFTVWPLTHVWFSPFHEAALWCNCNGSTNEATSTLASWDVAVHIHINNFCIPICSPSSDKTSPSTAFGLKTSSINLSNNVILGSWPQSWLSWSRRANIMHMFFDNSIVKWFNQKMRLHVTTAQSKVCQVYFMVFNFSIYCFHHNLASQTVCYILIWEKTNKREREQCMPSPLSTSFPPTIMCNVTLIQTKIHTQTLMYKHWDSS